MGVKEGNEYLRSIGPIIRSPDADIGGYSGTSGGDLNTTRNGRSWAGFAGDTAVGLTAGVADAVSGIIGLGSYVPGVHYAADPLSEGAADFADAIRDAGYTDHQKEQNERFAQAVAGAVGDLGPDATTQDYISKIATEGGVAAAFLVKNPSAAIAIIAETVPSIVAGGGLKKGAQALAAVTKAKKASQYLAGTAGTALGQGALAAGSAVSEIVQHDREQGDYGFGANRYAGLGAGAVVGGTTYLGGRWAGKADIDSQLSNLGSKLTPGGRSLPKDLTAPSKWGLVGGTIKGAGVEALEESVQGGFEQGFINAGQGNPLSQDVGKAIASGAFAGGALGAGGGVLQGVRDLRTQPDAVQEAVEAVIAEAGEQAQPQAQPANPDARTNFDDDPSFDDGQQQAPATPPIDLAAQIIADQQALDQQEQGEPVSLQDLLDLDAQEQAVEERRQQDEADTAALLQRRQEDEALEARRDRDAQLFTKEDFVNRRNEQRVAEALDETTQLGKAFTAWRKSKQLYGVKDPKTVQAYLDETALGNEEDLVHQEYIAALDAFSADQAAAGNPAASASELEESVNLNVPEAQAAWEAQREATFVDQREQSQKQEQEQVQQAQSRGELPLPPRSSIRRPAAGQAAIDASQAQAQPALTAQPQAQPSGELPLPPRPSIQRPEAAQAAINASTAQTRAQPAPTAQATPAPAQPAPEAQTPAKTPDAQTPTATVGEGYRSPETSAILATPQGQRAASQWDETGGDTDVAFAELSEDHAVAWLTESIAQEESESPDGDKLADLKRQIEQEHAGPGGSATEAPFFSPHNLDGSPLSAEQQAVENTAKEKDKADKKREVTRFGVAEETDTRATRESFGEMLGRLTGSATNPRVHVFDNQEQAENAVGKDGVPDADVAALTQKRPYGWVSTDAEGSTHAHFILNRIAAGNEEAAFMHEVGSHIGLDGIMTPEQQQDAAQQIYSWVLKDDGSPESRIAQAAWSRILLANAKGALADGAINAELIAYTVEEATAAGVKPNTKSAVGLLIEQIMDLAKAALERFNLVGVKDLTPQALVDLAYGSARMELSTGPIAVRNGKAYLTKSGEEYQFLRKTFGDQAAKKFAELASIGRQAGRWVTDLNRFVDRNKHRLPGIEMWREAMIRIDAVAKGVRDSAAVIVAGFDKLNTDEKNAVNKVIDDFTTSQKWGYDPKRPGGAVQIDPDLARAFNKLTSKGQQVVKDTFEYGHQLRERQAVALENLGVDKKSVDRFRALQGPYAPKKRFGGYVAVLKSQALVDAQEAGNRELVETLKRNNPQNYRVRFFPRESQAKDELAKGLKEGFSAAGSTAGPRTENTLNTDADITALLSSIGVSFEGKAAAAGLDKNTRAMVEKLIADIFADSLADGDARQSSLPRLDVAGHESDMMKSFGAHAKAQAQQISWLEHGAEYAEGLRQAKEVGEAAGGELAHVYNHMAKHHLDITNTSTTWFDRVQKEVTPVVSFFELTTNIAYHTTNATQPIMVSLPKIAGDHGNYAEVFTKLMQNYKTAKGVIKLEWPNKLKPKLSLDFSSLSKEHRELMEHLDARGLITTGLAEDLSSFDRANTGDKLANAAIDGTKDVMARVFEVSRLVEAYNRVSAAITAYDMAKKNPGRVARLYDDKNALDYAVKIVEETQGDFSSDAAPLLLKKLPRIMVQFRQYQVMMAHAYYDAGTQAFAGATAEERAAGVRTLTFLTASAGVMAGAVGLPAANLVTTIYAMLAGADEPPEDIERVLREQLGDDLGTLVARGFGGYIGVDFSTKLSQAHIFSAFPFVDHDAPFTERIAEMVAGPTGSVMDRWYKGGQFFGTGQTLKGIESFLPKGLRNATETFRYANEGYSLTNGDIVLQPQEFETKGLIGNLVGLTAGQVRNLRWTNSQHWQINEHFRSRQAVYRRLYREATKAGNTQRLKKLEVGFLQLQAQKDELRPWFNDEDALPKLGVKYLTNSVSEADKREAKNRQRLTGIVTKESKPQPPSDNPYAAPGIGGASNPYAAPK